jgi:hypothetical protein
MNSGFLPGVNVLTSEFRFKPISELKINDNIFSQPSFINKVHDVEKSKYSGNVIQIRCLGQIFNVECSNEQEFYAVKKEFRDYCRKKFSQIKIEVFENNIEIIQAKMLKKGDMLIIPKHSMKSDIKTIKTEDFIYSHSPKIRFILPNQINLTKKLFRWFGYFLAEGMVVYTSDKRFDKKCSGINFTINLKENYIFKDIVSTGKEIFHLNPRVIDFHDRNGRRVDYYSTQLGEMMFSLFNTGSSNKKIHPYLMMAQQDLLDELVIGWLAGDGWICNSKGKKGLVIGNTTSLQLANQIYIILINRGRLPSLNIAAHKNQNRTKAREMGFFLKHPLYSIILPKNLNVCRRKQNNYFIFTPISELKSRSYNGFIYNLRVKKTNSYQANYYWVPGLNSTEL